MYIEFLSGFATLKHGWSCFQACLDKIKSASQTVVNAIDKISHFH